MTSLPQSPILCKVPLSPRAPETQTGTTITQQQETARGLPQPDILELVDIGLSIIPIERGAKQPPQGLQWRRYQERAATREQVQEWQRDFPGCNWAAVWGAVSGNVIAVDIDSPAAFGWCQKQGGFNQRWPVWYSTGRGWQYLFRVPEELADRGVIVPHKEVEIRTARHISVLPPSTHRSGKQYQWKRFGRIPYAPEWILDILRGKAPQETATSITPQQRPAQTLTQRAYPVARRDRHARLAGVNPRILKAEGYRWLWSTTFPEGSRNSAFFSLAILLRAAGLDEEEATRKLDQWRHKCTRPVYSEREAASVIKTTYRISYGVTVPNLRKAINVKGETMPERAALELTRLFPNLRRKRGQQIHEPLFVSVGKILELLYKKRVLKPTVITHAEMAAATRLSESRVEKVADFLSAIGVRTTTRQGRSTVSSYNLKGLTTPTTQLIKHLAEWRGYAVSWRALASRLWRRVHSLMRAVLSHLNDVFNWLSATWRSETTQAAVGFQSVALAGVSGRAPPNW